MALNQNALFDHGAEQNRRISLTRAEELKKRIADYLEVKDGIPTGLTSADKYEFQKRKISALLGASGADWEDWRWQFNNRIKTVETLGRILDLQPWQKANIEKVGKKFRWAISPYFAALVAAGEPQGPLWRQSIPHRAELHDTSGTADPMGEEMTSPAPGITRRYPDRLIINVTNMCAMFCRHCQRRRNIGELDRHKSKYILMGALDYIRANPEIRDVLITGGDALLLSDQNLDWLLGELDKIRHVEIKRLGTRVIVTMPQRITPELCAVLEKHPPVYVNTQFNHPLEVTPESAEACSRLIKAGVVLGNQAVLLRGVNNSHHIMKKLNQELLKIRVRPYYIFHAKKVVGTAHFIASIDEGLEIMEKLRGYTSGLAIPTYVINTPGGLGKTPVCPQYILSRTSRFVALRTWEKKVIHYPDMDL